MSGKVVSLTVHKNNRDQRRRHRVSKLLVADAKQVTRAKDVSGYAIVAWNDDQDADVEFVSGGVDSNVLPDFVGGAIRRKIGMMDTDDA